MTSGRGYPINDSPEYRGRTSGICLGPPPEPGNSSNNPAGTEERPYV